MKPSRIALALGSGQPYYEESQYQQNSFRSHPQPWNLADATKRLTNSGLVDIQGDIQGFDRQVR